MKLQYFQRCSLKNSLPSMDEILSKIVNAEMYALKLRIQNK